MGIWGRETLDDVGKVRFVCEGEEARGTHAVSYLKFQREWEYGGVHDKPMQVPNEHLQLQFLGIPTKQQQPTPNINSVRNQR